MQNAWRFVEDPALRERLKEAKGIGTPATRAEIIKGLKRQNLLALERQVVVPTEAGLELYDLLSEAAPALVDPGTTAVWEMRLDGILRHAGDVVRWSTRSRPRRTRLIEVLKQQTRPCHRPGIRHPPRLPGGRRRSQDAAAEPACLAGPRPGKGRDGASRCRHRARGDRRRCAKPQASRPGCRRRR